MSILSSAIHSVMELLMPRRCPICGGELQQGHHFICTGCLLDAPLTQMWHNEENAIVNRVKALRPDIVMASSLIFYIRNGRWSHSIHKLKYSGEWRYCIHYGEWLGYELNNSPLYKGIDAVVAIPLHPRRRLSRGYNQSEYIAEGVARSMKIEHLRGVVRRKRYNPSQAQTHRDDRWRNVEDLFEVCDVERLRGRNILLVDDVFTTGATMLSCAEVMMDSCPGLRLWIATVAVARSQFEYGAH